MSTIQFDFNMPARFNLAYVGDDGQEHQPYMVHRALLGSLERFLGVLIEHYAGAFPLWLAPEQVRVIPVTEKQLASAEAIGETLQQADVRARVDRRSEKMGAKIRDAQVEKVPYMLIVGQREVEAGTVSVRSRTGGDTGAAPLEQFLAMVREEVAGKGLAGNKGS